MMHFLLFIGLSFLVFGLLSIIQKKKKGVKSGTILALFIFGVFLSIPFVLIEHMAFNLKYYLVILAFIGIELIIVTVEHKWEYLHNLIHHNIEELRLLSFFLVSIGFTYSELSFHILNSSHGAWELLASLPFRAFFALFIHTVLTTSAALLTTTESIFEHVLMFFLHYLKLIFISVSHYLYVFFVEHKATYLLIPFLAYNIYLLFKHKKYLDRKAEVLA